METQNISNLKNQTHFYSRWWGNITNYLEGWNFFFWNMFTPKNDNQEKSTERNETTRVKETESALNGFAKQYRIEANGIHGTLEFMEIIKPEVLQIMREN